MNAVEVDAVGARDFVKERREDGGVPAVAEIYDVGRGIVSWVLGGSRWREWC